MKNSKPMPQQPAAIPPNRQTLSSYIQQAGKHIPPLLSIRARKILPYRAIYEGEDKKVRQSSIHITRAPLLRWGNALRAC